MLLTSIDPFVQEFERQFDRLTRQATGHGNGTAMPMDGTRRPDDVLLRFDLPGIDPGSIFRGKGFRGPIAGGRMTLPLDDENAALFTVGQVASMLDVRQAFLRRIDEHAVVSPRRSAGGQRRYSRHEIDRVRQVVTMMDEGISLPAIRRIFELQHELARLTRERDELARRLDDLSSRPTGS